jgi:tRNA pseudouridine55 synthase
MDLDATVRCSSGTYVRALARDLGTAVGTGGHLTRLRRTRVGGYGIDQAHTLDQLAENLEVLPLAQAASAAFPGRQLTADEARRLAHGGRLAATGGADAATGAGVAGAAAVIDPRTPTAAYAPDGTLIALLTEESGQARPLVVFA